MRHKKLKYTLGLEKSHRNALLSNLMRSLIFHKRIKTTEAKAKALSREMDKVISSAKKGPERSWKQVAKKLRDKEALKELFDLIVPTYDERNGGFTRIIKTMPRKGDGAMMAFVELVDFEEEITEKEREQMKARAERKRLRREREEEEIRRMEEEEAMAAEGDMEREPEREEEGEKEGGLLNFFRRFKKKDRDPEN